MSVARTVPEPDGQTPMTRPGGLGYRWPWPIPPLQAALRGHPYRQDVLLSICVLLLSLSPQSGKRVDALHVTLLFATSAAQSVPLIWRRRAPLAVYYVVLAACIVQWATEVDSGSAISLMICVYTVARYRSVRALQVAAVATVPALLVYTFQVAQSQHQGFAGLIFLGIVVAASIVLGLVIEERKAQLAALAERAAHAEFEREQRAQMAVLAERARFSREMHDIVGHTLAVVIGLSDGGVRQVEVNPERGREVFELIGEASRHALADLRRTLGALRERPLDEGIEGIGGETLTPQPGVAEVSGLLERTRSAGPRVSYRSSGETAALPQSLQLAIYRIVQESLTNSLKHAGPDTSVEVTIDVGEESLRVSVSDTGPKTRRTAPASADSPGLGLTGVRERAALAGGRAEAGPNVLGGWTVSAHFPSIQPSPLNPAEES